MSEQKVKKREWVKTAAIIFLSVMLVLTFASNTFMNYSLPEVAVQYVQAGAISAKIRGTGTVSANESYEVKSTQSREVLSVPVKVGDKVEVGDTLALYSEGESSQIKEVEAALDQLVFDYQNMLLDAADITDREQRRAIELAQKALDKAKAERASNTVTPQQLVDAKTALKKAEANVDTQQDKVNELQKQLDKLTEGTDYTAQITAKEAELAEARTNLETMKNISYKTGYDNLTKWAQAWKDADKSTDSLENYKTALAQALTRCINNNGSLAEEPSELKATRPADVEYNLTTIRGIVDAYNAVYAQEQKIKLVEAELYSLYLNHGGSGNYETVKKQLKEANVKLKELQALQKDAEAALAELEAKKKNFEANDAAVDAAQTELENAMYALEKQQRDNGKQQSKDALKFADARKKIEKKKEELAELKAGGTGASVESKVNGIVTAVNITAGNVAEANQTLMTIEVPDMGYGLSIPVTIEQSKRVSRGDTAEINYYYGSNLTATLVDIKTDPQNPTTSRLLSFKIQGEVQSGVQLSISIGERGQNYEALVPNSAVRTDNNGQFVLAVIAKDSPLGNRYIAQRMDVKVLATDDANSAVSGALIANSDFVITTSTKPIEPGMQVRLVD